MPKRLALELAIHKVGTNDPKIQRLFDQTMQDRLVPRIVKVPNHSIRRRP